jgi:hypothetical protein
MNQVVSALKALGFGLVDFIIGIPTVFMGVVHFVMQKSETGIIPGVDINPNIVLFIQICFGFYWVARGIQVLQKSYADHQSGKLEAEAKKIENTRARRQEHALKTAVYTTPEQLKKIGEFEEKQMAEREQYLKKIGVKNESN